MSPDEVFAFFIALAVGAFAWVHWLRRSLAVSDFLSSRASRTPLVLAPVLSAAALLVVLLFFASHDVRDSVPYLAFYVVLGAAWVGLGVGLLSLFGLRPPIDVAQRRNPAAGIAGLGAVLGLTLAFAGANIGDGPGWWVVLYSSALSTLAVFLIWMLADAVAGTTDMVTIDRDFGAGIRLACFLIAVGAIQGRAVAGNWVSAGATAADWLDIGWPALGLCVFEMVVGRMHAGMARRESPPAVLVGVLPGLLYLAGAAAYSVSLGWWS
ncbi:MAG: hypothetical protein KJZ65_12505 [Phycisphaerales bacterium]|nr:hypothetical protein [Phycisphaerales bacterium]